MAERTHPTTTAEREALGVMLLQMQTLQTRLRAIMAEGALRVGVPADQLAYDPARGVFVTQEDEPSDPA
jgi:hypothetical protein